MDNPHVLDANHAALIVVDVQERLMPHIAGASAVTAG
jgi:hypothetical protein